MCVWEGLEPGNCVCTLNRRSCFCSSARSVLFSVGRARHNLKRGSVWQWPCARTYVRRRVSCPRHGCVCVFVHNPSANRIPTHHHFSPARYRQKRRSPLEWLECAMQCIVCYPFASPFQLQFRLLCVCSSSGPAGREVCIFFLLSVLTLPHGRRKLSDLLQRVLLVLASGGLRKALLCLKEDERKKKQLNEWSLASMHLPAHHPADPFYSLHCACTLLQSH